MKISFAQPLPFDGYQLKIADAAMEKKRSLLLVSRINSLWVEKNSKNKKDAPENWDEAWFSNYE